MNILPGYICLMCGNKSDTQVCNQCVVGIGIISTNSITVPVPKITVTKSTCTCDNHQLMWGGCICGHIKRMEPATVFSCFFCKNSVTSGVKKEGEAVCDTCSALYYDTY